MLFAFDDFIKCQIELIELWIYHCMLKPGVSCCLLSAAHSRDCDLGIRQIDTVLRLELMSDLGGTFGTERHE